MCLDGYRKLAKALNAPPMLTEVLPLIVKHNQIEVLICLSEKEQSVAELASVLNLPRISLESMIDELFKAGFLKKKKNREIRYSVKPFQSIVNRFLSENRAQLLGKHAASLAKLRLEEHVSKAKTNPHPEGKVLPIPEAYMEPTSIVVPHESAISVLEKARSFSLRDCECRMTYRNCDKPVETCLGLNEFSDELVERGVAKEISLEEAKKVLKIANEHGLVHQVIYSDWLRGEVSDMCSCCPCCCMHLRALFDYGVKHHIAKSGYIAVVDSEKCAGCGACVNRCMFHARKIHDGKSIVVEDKCYGCGLCTATCPKSATKLSISQHALGYASIHFASH